MRVDLHLHTTYSDGSLTPGEVVDIAKAQGLCAVSITDHDECRGYFDVADEKDIKVLSGIEISADFYGEVHVLGYNIDCRDADLTAYIKEQYKNRRDRAEKMIERFSDFGVELSIDEVLEECEGDVLGRPHIASVLVKKGIVNSANQAFSRFLGRHSKCYVPRKKADVKTAVELINGAGGAAVLAHPGLMHGKAWSEISGRLKEFGFWGIEAYHSNHTDGQVRELTSFAEQNGFFVTAGSDFHGASKPELRIGQEQRGGKYLENSLLELGINCV